MLTHAEIDYVVKNWSLKQKLTFIQMHDQLNNMSTEVNPTAKDLPSSISMADEIRDILVHIFSYLEDYDYLIGNFKVHHKRLRNILEIVRQLSVSLRTREVSFVTEFLQQDGINALSTLLIKVNRPFRMNLE